MRFIDTCSYTESYNPHRYTFSNKCVITGQPYSVTVEGAELYQFRQTNRIDSFQSNSLADRKFLISGISPEGWKQVFSDDPEFDEESFDEVEEERVVEDMTHDLTSEDFKS